jgi:hypothetical protein
MCLLFLASCFSKIETVTHEVFNAEILAKKNRHRPYALLLYTPCAKRFKESFQALDQAAVISNGTVYYGMVNCQGERALCSRLYRTENLPIIVVGNSTTHHEIDAPFNPVSIAKHALQYIASPSIKVVDDFWLDDLEDIPSQDKKTFKKPTAILFTKRDRIPAYFRALSRCFNSSQFRFGICNDESLIENFGVTEIPSIVFYNATAVLPHEGPRRIRFLKESAAAFLEGRESRAPVHSEFYVNTEFPEICYDYSVSCVFSYDNVVEPKLEETRVQFKNDPFRFFVGTDPLPFPGIRQGDFVVFNAKKMAIINVKDVAQLAGTLDRVLDGGAKWTPLAKFDYHADL